MAKSEQGSGFIANVKSSYFPSIFLFLSIVIGSVALWLTPKEEDPQIVVPMADVIIHAPGLSATQVENQVTEPLEKLVSQIDGVEYVYSASMSGQAQVIVRFFVGEDRERALVRLYNKLFSNQDKIPQAVSQWMIKPIEIDDVPIVVAALYSETPDKIGLYELRRVAEQASLGSSLLRIQIKLRCLVESQELSILN
ncbi:efflux RND transporter permease subunit [Vibrio sonorensis]|uniref:efflux RND transporter permease subunit n=1 Tax=Vibrio sonorensis TaxID=1004316 RepID=UPI000AF4F84D